MCFFLLQGGLNLHRVPENVDYNFNTHALSKEVLHALPVISVVASYILISVA